MYNSKFTHFVFFQLADLKNHWNSFGNGAVCVLAKRQLKELTSIKLAAITIVVLLKFKKVQDPFIILVAAITGLIIKNYL